MNEDIFGRKRKKKSALSPVEALYNGTLAALQDLDFSSQIYHPNLFQSYDPSIKINTNQDKRKDEIPKTSTHLQKKIFDFETDVGLVKSSSRNLQSHQEKPPLKLGTSRNLSVSPTVLEKLDISLAKPVTSFGFDPIFVPSIRNTKYKSINAKKRKRNRKKITELPAFRFPGLDDPIPDTSEDKKYVSENIFDVKTKIDNYPIKDSSDSPPNISGDIYIPQNRVRKYIECSEANQEISKNEANIKTSKPPKPKTSSSTITAEFLRPGEEPLDLNYEAIQRIEREQEKLKNEIEQLSLQVKEHTKAKRENLVFSKTETEAIGIQAKELQKYSTTILDASENSSASVPNTEPQKSKSNNKKDKSIVPCARETKQQTCEPKLTCTESTSVKTTRPSHLRKQITPQKNKNPGLILLSSISETSRKDSSELFNQPVWDRTARPRFNINLQPISTEAQRSETKISETNISAHLPEVAPKQEVLVKIQTTGTKTLRPCLNIEMQSVSSEANISVGEGVPDVNKSRSVEVLLSETTKKVQSSKKGFKIPSNLLRETTPKDEAISSKLEILDSKQKPRPRPSYSTQSKSAKPYKLTYEEITPPEVVDAISAKESQSPSSDIDDKGQPILRLRLDPNLPEPRPRENLFRPKPIRVAPIDAPRTPYQNVYPEKHNSQSNILWKNVSYVVDSFAEPEEISSTKKLLKFLPPLKKDYTKLKKISSPSSDTSKSPKLPSSPPEPNGSRKVESPIQRTKKQTKKVKKLPRNQPESSESLKLVSPLPEPKKQPQASEVCKSESLSPTQEQKKAQSDLFEIHKSATLPSVSSKNRKLESSPPKSNNKAVKTQGTPCTQSESSEISRSESPSSRPSANRRLASPTHGPSEIRKLASTSQPSGSGRLASPTSEPSGNRRLVSPTPGPSGIRRLASPTPGPSGIRRLASPTPGPSGIHKLAFPTPGASEIHKSPTLEPGRICKSSPPMPGSSKICLSGTPTLEPSEIRTLTTPKLEPSEICTPLTSIPEPSEIRTSTAPTPEPSAIRTSSSSTLEPSKICTSSEASEIPTSSTPAPKPSEIRWSSTPTTEPSEIRTSVSRKSTSRASKSRSPAFCIPGPRGICKSSNILGSHKISKKSYSSRYKQAVQFKRSSFTQSESISPPQEPCDKPKYALPREKKPYTQSESSGSPKSASPPQDCSTAQIKSLSLKPKTQTAKRRSPYTQTDPSGSHKPMSSSSDVMSKLAASPPEESSESRQFETGSSDLCANLEKLPFPPPQPVGFRNLSRKVRYMKKRSALYDERGIHIESGKDICDCLVPNCKGCFNPCTKCRSTKCGLNCRVHRTYVLDEECVD